MKHFTSTQSFFEIINSGKIRLSSSVKLNDPLEQKLVDNIREIMIINKENYKQYKQLENEYKNDKNRYELSWKLHANAIGSSDRLDWEMLYYFMFENNLIKGTLNTDFHISSFAEIEENLAPLHWLNYANNCKGLCIEFNMTFFEKASNKLSPKYFPVVKPVKYEPYDRLFASFDETIKNEKKNLSEDITSDMFDYMKPYVEAYSKDDDIIEIEGRKEKFIKQVSTKLERRMKTIGIEMEKVIFNSVFYKNPSYSNEQEIRLCLLGDRAVRNGVYKKEFSCDGRVIFSYIDIPFVLHKNKEEIEKIQEKASTNIFNDLPNPINKIYIGWNNRMKVQDIKNFLESHDYNVEDIEIKKVSLNSIKANLSTEKLVFLDL